MIHTGKREGGPCLGGSLDSRTNLRRAAALLALASWGQTRLAAMQQAPASPAGMAFQHVTVVDVQDGQLRADQTVVVIGTRIQALGAASKVRVPRGAQVIDARSKYLIPGLWDMHVHDDEPERIDEYYARYLAHGVTGVREMSQRFVGGADSFRVWQRDIMAGHRVGPRVFGPSADIIGSMDFGSMFGMKGEGPGVIKVQSVEEVRHAVDSLHDAGMMFLKLHDDLMPRSLYFALLREARRVGIAVVGHTPALVTDVEVADSGQRSVEHVGECIRCVSRLQVTAGGEASVSPADSAERERACAATAAAFVRNATWFVPTLIVYQDSSRRALVTQLHRGGIPILAGTDVDDDRRGFALLEEVRLLAEAGLTPLEALQSATLNPAKYLHGTDSLGTVEQGKLADLVLLDANPLADITNLRTVRAVVANGRYFDRAALDRLLAGAEAAAPSP